MCIRDSICGNRYKLEENRCCCFSCLWTVATQYAATFNMTFPLTDVSELWTTLPCLFGCAYFLENDRIGKHNGAIILSQAYLMDTATVFDATVAAG